MYLSGRLLKLLHYYNGTTSELLGHGPYDAYVWGGMSSLLLVELFLDEGCLGRSPGWSLAPSDDFLLPSCYGGTIYSTLLMVSAYPLRLSGLLCGVHLLDACSSSILRLATTK